jgi:hypothetical protein
MVTVHHTDFYSFTPVGSTLFSGIGNVVGTLHTELCSREGPHELGPSEEGA